MLLFCNCCICINCTYTHTQVESLTRVQSKLANAASNRPHTQHTLDSITRAVPKICRGSQKSKVDHMTQTQICNAHMTYCCKSSLGASAIYMHAKLQASSFSHSGDRRGIPKFIIMSGDAAPDPLWPTFAQFLLGPLPLCTHTRGGWGVACKNNRSLTYN